MASNEQYGSWHADNELQPAHTGSNMINVGWNERLTSSTLGAFLLSSGLNNLTKHPIKALAKTVSEVGYYTGEPPVIVLSIAVLAKPKVLLTQML